jgi:hypothetical protein
VADLQPSAGPWCWCWCWCWCVVLVFFWGCLLGSCPLWTAAHYAYCDRSPLVAGTGGTLAGVARFLKSKNPGIKIFLADPPGSVLHRFVQSKGAVVGERSGSSITEGIGQVRERTTLPPVSKTRHVARHVKALGTPPPPCTCPTSQGRVTDNLKDTPIDDSVLIPDEETIAMVRGTHDFSLACSFHHPHCHTMAPFSLLRLQVYTLLKHEGLFIGASSALNVVAAGEAAGPWCLCLAWGWQGGNLPPFSTNLG